jgi:hypothetical protein
MKPIDVIQHPINSSIEEWCIRRAEQNKQRVLTLMKAGGISLDESQVMLAKGVNEVYGKLAASKKR